MCLQHCSVNSFTKITPTKKTTTLPQSKANKEKPPLAIVKLELPKASVDRAAPQFYLHNSGGSKIAMQRTEKRDSSE